MPNSIRHWWVTLVYPSCNENNQQELLAALRPFARQRAFLQKHGLVVNGRHIAYYDVASANDWKRYLGNHRIVHSVASSCASCGAKQNEFMSNIGQYESRTDDGYKAFVRKHWEVLRSTNNSKKARKLSHGLQSDGDPLAITLYQRRFDILHAELATANEWQRFFALEMLHSYNNMDFFTLPEKEWTKDMHNQLDAQIKIVRGILCDKFHCKMNFMPEADLSRLIRKNDAHEELLETFVVEERRVLLREMLETYSHIMKIMRQSHPSIADIKSFKVVWTVPYGKLIIEAYPNMRNIPYYTHHLIEHAQEMMEEYGNIGMWSCEKSESVNKLIKFFLKFLTRPTAVDAATDIIKRLWWMNDPEIRDWMDNSFKTDAAVQAFLFD